MTPLPVEPCDRVLSIISKVLICRRELDAENGVRSWTDFLKVYLQPQSLCLLPGLWQGACDFSGFGHGSSALRSEEFREEALDRVRLFAEECDALQVTELGSIMLALLEEKLLYLTIAEVQDRFIRALCHQITAESAPAKCGPDPLAASSTTQRL